MSARDIALRAYEQAKAAAALEAAHEEAIKEDDRRRKIAEHIAIYEAALPILAEWFPGVKWEWWEQGDYGFDTILTDASEDWPPSFKLRVTCPLIKPSKPSLGRKVMIEIGDYQADSSMPGYSYFSGHEVKSAADIGRAL